MKNFLILSSFAIIFTFGVVALVSASNHWVFTEPSQAPPAGNVAPPLNVGGDVQAKLGGLILGRGNVPIGLMVEQGKVGIGMTDPTQVNARLTVFGDVSVRGPINQPSPYLSLGDDTSDSIGSATYVGPTPPPDTCDGDQDNVYVCAAEDAMSCTDIARTYHPFTGEPEYWERPTTCSINNNAFGLRTNAGVLEIGLTSTPTTPFLTLDNSGVLRLNGNEVCDASGNCSTAETDTLATVVSRGNSTPSAITTGGLTANGNIHMTGVMTGSAWVGYKWVQNGVTITCTTNGNTRHSARVDNGRLQVRAEVVSGPFFNTADSGWQDGMEVSQLVTGYTVAPGTYIKTSLINRGPSSSEKDLFGDGRSNVTGTATCSTIWP